MPEIINESPVEGLGQFFDTIWHAEPGYVYLPTLNRKTEEWKKNMFKWPEHREHVVNHVLGKTSQGLDVYYSPVLFDLEKEPRPVKENFKGTFVVWTEYDGSAPSEWPSVTSEGADGATVDAVVPPPSLRVQSSKDGNEHVYWQLEEFVTDREWVENINRSITYGTRADTSGWDINQVLRPPYTKNYKYEDEPAVTVSHISRDTFSRERFAALPPVQQLVNNAIDTEHLPLVEEVIATYKWSTDDFKFFMDPSIPEGKRSFALMRLGYIGAEMGMNDTEIYALLDNADARWGKYVKRADRKIRLLDIVNRARTKHPQGVSSTFQGLLGVSDVETGAQQVYGFKDFLDSDLEIEWIIEDLLELGGLGMVAASPGVGKTQLSIQLGIAGALNLPFLEWKFVRPLRVAILSLEMSHVALKKFMTVISREYSEDQIKALQDNLYVVPLGEVLDLTAEAPRTFTNTLLDQIKPDLVIVDSLGKLSSGKLDEDTVRKINDQLAAIRRRFKCGVWLIHHNRKANGENKEPTSLDDVYGNVYITAEATVVLVLHKKKPTDKDIKLITVKSRLAPEKDIMTLNRNENLHFEVVKGAAVTFDNILKGGDDADNVPNEASGDGGANFGM